MQIKDVEKLTGLTAKSIRYYESKGLLIVERKEGNAYRDYTEENVHRLKEIKLLRWLDFTVEEIKQIFEGGMEETEAKLREAAAKKAKYYEELTVEQGTKKELCLALAKDYKSDAGIIDEYNETIDFLESEDFSQLKNNLITISCPSLAELCIETLVFLGPILWLFVNIKEERTGMLLFNAVCAIAATVFITLGWRSFFYKRQFYKNKMKQKDRFSWTLIPFILVSVVGCIAAFLLANIVLEQLLLPEDYLFWGIDPRLDYLFVICLMFPVLMLISACLMRLRSRKLKKEQLTEEELLNRPFVFDVYDVFAKHPMPVWLVWLACLYWCTTSMTAVTEDKIIRYTPFCPMGQEYTYADVEKVEAGYGSKTLSVFFYNRKGEFSYTIYLDGKKCIFYAPNVNEEIERYMEHTYLELEEFDAKLMELGISKESSDANSEDALLDQEYLDRFMRIIQNK